MDGSHASKEPVLEPPPKRTRILPAASISWCSGSNAGSSGRIDRRSAKTVMKGTPTLMFSSDCNMLIATVLGISMECNLHEAGHPPSSTSPPTSEQMTRRFDGALGSSVQQIINLYRFESRGLKRNKSQMNSWFDNIQKSLHDHLLKRRCFESATQRAPTLQLVIVYHPGHQVAVSFEETCPGMASYTLQEISCVLKLGAFSTSMDLAEILMTNGGAPANKRNWRRKEQFLYEGFSALIKDAEAGGASVLAIRN